MEKSVLFNYRKEILELILASVGKGKSFTIPTSGYLMSAIPAIAQGYLKTYLQHEEPDGNKGIVAQDIQLLQGMAYDDKFFAMNKHTGDFALYTYNQRQLAELGGVSVPKGKVYTSNLDGIVYAFRLDIENISANKTTMKATRVVGKKVLFVADYYFIPFFVVEVISRILQDSLGKGLVLKIGQEVKGVLGDSLVTRNALVLNNYPKGRETPSVASKGDLIVDNNRAVLYAPRVGASDTSFGRSRINLLGIETLESVKDDGNLVPERNLTGILKTVVMSTIQLRLKECYTVERLDDFHNILNAVVKILGVDRVKEILMHIEEPEGMPEGAKISLGGLVSLISSMDDEQVYKLWSYEPLKFDIKRGGEVYSLVKRVSESVIYPEISSEELRELLKDGIYKITIVKKNGTFSTKLVTNNYEILRRVYGENYFAEYESIGVRFKRAKYLLNEGKEFTEVVKECGFTGLEGVSYTGNGIEILEDYVYNTLNYKERTFTDDNVICRKLFGLYNGESISDYYISIKPENIYEIARVTE